MMKWTMNSFARQFVQNLVELIEGQMGIEWGGAEKHCVEMKVWLRYLLGKMENHIERD